MSITKERQPHDRIVFTENEPSPYRERSAIVSGLTASDQGILTILLKRTFTIYHKQPVQRMAEARPFFKIDRYYEDGDSSSHDLLHETDCVPHKAATDIVVHGHVYTKAGEKVYQIDCGIEINGKREVLRAIGDRSCFYRPRQDPVFSDPIPFSKMPLLYQSAYGGSDTQSVMGTGFTYPRNPIGKGYIIRNIPESVDRKILPNLENPYELLTEENIVLGSPKKWMHQPIPKSFGWIGKSWFPRSLFQGRIPQYIKKGECLQEEIEGVVPKGYIRKLQQLQFPTNDMRVYNGASPNLIFPYLQGHDALTLFNLTASTRQLTFFLPPKNPTLTVDVGRGKQHTLATTMQTVSIWPDELKVDIVYGGSLTEESISHFQTYKDLVYCVHD